jgi:pyroglutamyl-peptidase
VGADAIVALGLAPETPHVRIERSARNLCTAPVGDAKNDVRAGSVIVPGAPVKLRAALDPHPIARALSFAGIAHAFSDDAGGYVCNDLYYRLLAARVPALFIHVPTHASHELARPLATGIALSVRALVRSRR